MNRRELEQHLQDLFEGNIGPEELAQLQRTLKADPEAREAYADYAELHNALQLRAEGIDLLQVMPMRKIVERRRRNVLRISFMAAAAVVLLGGVVASLMFPRTRQPSLVYAASPGSEVSVHHDLAKGRIPQGQVLELGSRLVIAKGTVELKFATGIHGIIRGPAELTLRRMDLIEMSVGTAWFKVPPGQEGFQVSTPGLKLTDFGTAFGIRTRPGFPSEVHVFDGKVEVLNLQGTKGHEKLTAGQARVAEASGGWQKIPIRPAGFQTRLPSTLPESSVNVTEVFIIGNELAYAADVSASDLLHELKPVTTGWNTNNQASPLELTDGIHGGSFKVLRNDWVQGAWTTVGATAEYHFGKGHDITSIQSIAGWNGAGFGNQAWTIEVKPVNGEWTTLAYVDCNELTAQPLDGGGASKVTLTRANGPLASWVEAIRVTAEPVAGSVENAFVWRELDVFGGPAGVDTNGR